MCISFFCSLDALDALDVLDVLVDALNVQHRQVWPLHPRAMGISFTCLGQWHRLVIFWKGFGHVWTFVQVFCRFPLGSVYSLQHLQIADGLLPEVSCSTRIEPPSFFFKNHVPNFTCWILLGAYWTTNGSFLKIHPARCETGAGFSDHCCVDTEVLGGTGGANQHPASHEIDAARTLPVSNEM